MHTQADTHGHGRLRVVVADDHPVFREGMVRALKESGHIEVVADLANGRDALAAVREHTPDMALLDYRMPGLDGVAVAFAIARDRLPTKTLILSAFEDSALVYDALASGAAGFVTKEQSRKTIVEAVLQCARGIDVMPPALAEGLAGEVRRREKGNRQLLTAREAEVIAMIAEGLSVPQMGRRLHLAPTTVRTHVQKLYKTLGVSDRGAAVAEAMRRHLIE
jgi:two-component system nitrate/nitrite response regulator NarL